MKRNKISRSTIFSTQILIIVLLISCGKTVKSEKQDILVKRKIEIPEGMVLIPKNTFYQGALPSDAYAMDHEKPRHQVVVDSFLIDVTEVTNAQYSKFVEETNYITLAERPVDWDELKKQVPAGTPKPHDSLLQPGSLIFKERPDGVANLYDFSQWWFWKTGANWRQPQGPGSTIEGKQNHPVIHIAYEDAIAYCKWAGRTLPTEAQWEYAATGGEQEVQFSWGNDSDVLKKSANTYTGDFPVKNDEQDGYLGVAPVKSFPANPFGLYDMSGNVWEWTSDWYDARYYQSIKDIVVNPKGPKTSSQQIKEKVIKGGSFLCNASYCASYRISSRMGNSLDSSSEHKGFRTVINL
ncbi:formylglycine-generating enzyme family protein [Aquimarina sp. 2201CG5-10]|uniref:formylglycine-generating enzyme family protein n=1 Tax=Aquimarina callyspongiae TaxID=3098150 RepID=UPI002AB39816|nr:formylglycine-generating enzyme family protein [Aquimarina sp. 2201CG5-10]MDY8138913.1 formylglycine-generating enzyme family protein [Aquimarina sp. 2201CG5-10]